MTKQELNYHKQEMTCVFCTNFDINIENSAAVLVCGLNRELIDEGGACDAYELDDKPF